MDEDNNLTEVVETKNIVKTVIGAEADGKVIDVDSLVFMNMWGLTPDFLTTLEDGFKEFFEKGVTTLEAKKAKADAKVAEEAKKAEAESVNKQNPLKFTRYILKAAI